MRESFKSICEFRHKYLGVKGKGIIVNFILIIFGIINLILQIIGLKNENIALLILSECSILLILIIVNLFVYPVLFKSLKYTYEKINMFTELVFLVLFMIGSIYAFYLRLDMYIEYTTATSYNIEFYIDKLDNNIIIKILLCFLPSMFYKLGVYIKQLNKRK